MHPDFLLLHSRADIIAHRSYQNVEIELANLGLCSYRGLHVLCNITPEHWHVVSC